MQKLSLLLKLVQKRILGCLEGITGVSQGAVKGVLGDEVVEGAPRAVKVASLKQAEVLSILEDLIVNGRTSTLIKSQKRIAMRASVSGLTLMSSHQMNFGALNGHVSRSSSLPGLNHHLILSNR